MSDWTPTPAEEAEQAKDRAEIQAHFASEPHRIMIPHPGGLWHLVCSERCQSKLADNPDFECFDDGCASECCACGRCSEPSKCLETGKGHAWHP